jgi:nickel-dependent lactate racemase
MNSNPLPSLFCNVGGEDGRLTDEDIKDQVHKFLDALGPKDHVMILPPDFTRFHSQAGKITRFISEYYNFCETQSDERGIEDQNSKKIKRPKSEFRPDIQIMPALGTHVPMSQKQKCTMFGDELGFKTPSPFLVHDWRNDVVTIGQVPSELVEKATNGMVSRPWPAQLNTNVWDCRNHNSKKQSHKSLVLSIGQIVPHEVLGMANFNKNLFVGVGGVEAINLSHFIGAVYGMENMMGRASNPLRDILNYASEHFLQKELDLWYILTVMGTDKKSGQVEMKGLYIGNDIECYNLACDLSLKVNFSMLKKEPKKIIVYLDESEFQSTWLGNKAIYRTRMAIATGGELIILAPGVRHFGEDEQIDKLIRTHGYIGTPAILEAMKNDEEMRENLSAVAHLIHGSSEGRFSIEYCPGHLTKAEIESVGFKYGDLKQMMERYHVEQLTDGWNNITVDGEEEEIYFISNPALGLWAVEERFGDSGSGTSQQVTEESPSQKEVDTAAHQSPADHSGGVGGWMKPPTD